MSLPLYDYSMKAELWRRANRENAAGLAPISLRITITKVRAELASGIEVPAAYWNSSTHCVEAPTNKNLRLPVYTAELIRKLNAQLVELKAAADRAYRALRQDYNDGRRSQQPTARNIREAVRGTAPAVAALPITVVQAMARFIDSVQEPGMNKAPATIASYRSRLGNLLEFLTFGLKDKKFLLQDVTLPTTRALER